MISIITYGRNDNYSYNLVKRTAFSFNCLAEVLTDDDDEILFVDYNTPDHLPTLPEAIWDTLTEKALARVKVIRISREIHERIKGDSPLPILENVSRNAAIVRSNPANRWMLSTNPDVLLVPCSKWPNLPALLRTLPDSFYELPRFDIPESVWSSLHRGDPQANMAALRDWLVSNQAAIAETIPDYRFQKYYLFDAPGDFQLAPREYFFRLRGFDESMNKYFHSDSNLAKRMWLLNGQRTDHLLEHVWVLHQDHYLSGEWTKTVTTIQHNDYFKHIIHQETIEANDENWGLRQTSLPCFRLHEKLKRQQLSLPALAPLDGSLPLSRELDWRLQPFIRLCHYQPEILCLYLREFFRVAAPGSRITYLGENTETLERIRQSWREVSPDGPPVWSLSDPAMPAAYRSPDIFLADFYYQRTEYWEKRVALLNEELQRQVAKGRIDERQAAEELTRFADGVDHEAQRERLDPLWRRHFPSLTLRTGSHVILLGCNLYVPQFRAFQEALGTLATGLVLEHDPSALQKLHSFYQRVKFHAQNQSKANPLINVVWALRLLKRRTFMKLIGQESIMGWVYYRHLTGRQQELLGRLNLRTLYTHHRLVVMRVQPLPGSSR
jgi:hypothetical protein